MLGLLITILVASVSIYYFTVIRKKWADEKARQDKIDSKKITSQTQKKDKSLKPSTNGTAPKSPALDAAQAPATDAKLKISKKKDHHSNKINHKNIEHALFLGSVKGFAGEITDYDYNDEYMVVASKDKHIRVFKINDLSANQFYYFAVDFGYPTAVAISSDSRYISYAINIDKSIELRSFDPNNSDIKKRSSPPKIFGKECHKEEIQKLSFDAHNKFIISSAQKSDTIVKIWSLQGKELSQYNTGHNIHYMARFSQLRKFYFIASWTSNFKTLTFITDKVTNEFKSITKGYGISHSASITYVNVDNLDQKAVTISKNEKCLKFWDINVNYEAQQDPKIIKQYKGEADHKALFDGKELIAVAGAVHNASGKVFYAVSNGEDIALLNSDFNRVELFKDVFTPEYPIHRLEFIQSSEETLQLLSCSFEEGRINIFNVSKFLL